MSSDSDSDDEYDPALPVQLLSVRSLSSYLRSEGFSKSDVQELAKRNIDGKTFVDLSREDIALVFPGPDKFLLGMKLYKLVQTHRSDPDSINTQELLRDLDNCGDNLADNSSVTNSSVTSRPSTSGTKRSRSTSSATSAGPPQKKLRNASDFRLPKFSPDIEKCIHNDSFYTSPQRNKIIRESCTALYGYCREKERPVTSGDKHMLAKLIYDCAPKSLGDPGDPDEPESGLYGQIIKWFQNHTFIERKLLGEVCTKKKKKGGGSQSSGNSIDDAESMEDHIRELQKEGRKVHADRDKLVRLQSDSYVLREQKMCDLASNTRPQETIKLYPFFKKPLHLMQDMFHAISAENRFSSKAAVVDKCTTVFKFWKDSLLPAVLMYAEEIKLSLPDGDDLNTQTLFALKTLSDRLKPRGSKKSSADRLKLMCYITEEFNDGVQDMNDPYILAVGSGPSDLSSMVIVFRKKTITAEIGQTVINGVGVLIAAYHVYRWEFNSEIKEVLNFLQE